MGTLDEAREIAKNIPKSTDRPQAELDVLIAEELSAKLFRVAEAMTSASGQVSKSLGNLQGVLGAVVTSMDSSTKTMARLTRWLIAAAIISAAATVAQVVLAIIKASPK